MGLAGTKFASVLAFLLAGALSLSCGRTMAQTTVGTGSIVGSISDQSGAVIDGARVTIKNAATGQVIELTTNSSGSFNSGALIPGDYTVHIAAKGFRSVEVSTIVLVGNTATVSVRLQIGEETQVVVVKESVIQVNTEQPTVQGVLNEEQIE